MQRRAFLMLMFTGAGAAAAVAISSGPSLALTSLAPLDPPIGEPSVAPEPAVATPADLERAKIEQSYWGRRRRFWRRRRYFWRRRYYRPYRRWYRPRFYRRRRFYYY